MNANVLDWKRIDSAVRQEARALGLTANAEEVCQQLRGLAEVCGPFTSNRKMLVKVGRVLLGESREIIVPICASNAGDLVKSHVVFLNEILTILPIDKINLLVGGKGSETEAELLADVKKTETMLKKLLVAMEASGEIGTNQNWEVKSIADIDLTMGEKELKKFREISNNLGLEAHINHTTIARSVLHHYNNIKDTRGATIRGAAQYVALGECADSHKMLVCNHQTIFLSWYLQTEAAVLHNPTAKTNTFGV